MPSMKQYMGISPKYFEPRPMRPGPGVGPGHMPMNGGGVDLPPIISVPILPTNPGIFTICPMPLVQAFPDDLRSFTRDGIAQMRVLPPLE